MSAQCLRGRLTITFCSMPDAPKTHAAGRREDQHVVLGDFEDAKGKGGQEEKCPRET